MTFDHICGTVDQFQNGAVFDPTVNVIYDADWIPTCCGRIDVNTAQLNLQYAVNDRPASQTYTYPVNQQTAAPDTPFVNWQVALNQGDTDPPSPGWLTAYYPGGVVAPAGWSQAVVSDENAVMQYTEVNFVIDDGNAVSQRTDATGWNLIVEQDGTSGSINFAVNDDGHLMLSGVNFVIDPDLIPSSGAGLDDANVFTQVQTIAPPTATTSGQDTVLLLEVPCTGVPAVGFGGEIMLRLDTDSNTMRECAAIRYDWRDVVDATRKGRLNFDVFDTSRRTAFTISTNGSAPMLGFFGVAPVVRPVASTSTIGFTQNAGTAVLDGSTFAGLTGGTAYTIDGIVTRLKQLGLLS